jgi:hypothetical protein
MASKNAKKPPRVPTLDGLIRAIADGLTGYMTYQARCGMSAVYCEYLLYDPVLRIARSQGWHVICEHKVGKVKAGPGDSLRIDFLLTHRTPEGRRVAAIEVKWMGKQKTTKLNLTHDIEKLKMVKRKKGDKLARYVVLAGAHMPPRTGRSGPDWDGLKLPPPAGHEALTLVYQPVFHGDKTCYGVTVGRL